MTLAVEASNIKLPLILVGLYYLKGEKMYFSVSYSPTVSPSSGHSLLFSTVNVRQVGQAYSPTKSGLWLYLNRKDCTLETYVLLLFLAIITIYLL